MTSHETPSIDRAVSRAVRPASDASTFFYDSFPDPAQKLYRIQVMP